MKCWIHAGRNYIFTVWSSILLQVMQPASRQLHSLNQKSAIRLCNTVEKQAYWTNQTRIPSYNKVYLIATTVSNREDRYDSTIWWEAVTRVANYWTTDVGTGLFVSELHCPTKHRHCAAFGCRHITASNQRGVNLSTVQTQRGLFAPHIYINMWLVTSLRKKVRN